MAQLLIRDLDDSLFRQLRDRAARHGRSVETEAKAILAAAVPSGGDAWATVNKLREELAKSGQEFPDSTPLLREDRDR